MLNFRTKINLWKYTHEAIIFTSNDFLGNKYQTWEVQEMFMSSLRA